MLLLGDRSAWEAAALARFAAYATPNINSAQPLTNIEVGHQNITFLMEQQSVK